MSENDNSFGGGILRGLKKILFTSDGTEQPAPPPQPQQTPSKGAVAPPPPPMPAQPTFRVDPTPASGPVPAPTQDMKLKVYQLLESMNKPGVDFFEVWNAATEMGGANTANIKAAFTSLRYADNSLNKNKLLETGEFYRTNLKNVLDSETRQRQDEKAKLVSIIGLIFQ